MLRDPITVRRRWLVSLATGLPGCAYDTDLFGIYFPSWLVSPVLGALLAGMLLGFLDRSAARQYLGNRTVLFCGMTVIFAVVVWWVAFRD